MRVFNTSRFDKKGNGYWGLLGSKAFHSVVTTTHELTDEEVAPIEKEFKQWVHDTYGPTVKCRIQTWEHEKIIGEWDGQDLYRYYYGIDFTISIPTGDECVRLFRQGAKFDKSKLTEEVGSPLYYLNVMEALTFTEAA